MSTVQAPLPPSTGPLAAGFREPVRAREIWEQWPTGHLVRTALVGSFPATLRERHALAWNALDQAQYDAIVVALKAVTLALPVRLRQIPSAWRTVPPEM